MSRSCNQYSWIRILNFHQRDQFPSQKSFRRKYHLKPEYRSYHHIAPPHIGTWLYRCNSPYPEKDLRAYPGTLQRTNEWNNTYKIQSVAKSP